MRKILIALCLAASLLALAGSACSPDSGFKKAQQNPIGPTVVDYTWAMDADQSITETAK